MKIKITIDIDEAQRLAARGYALQNGMAPNDVTATINCPKSTPPDYSLSSNPESVRNNWINLIKLARSTTLI